MVVKTDSFLLNNQICCPIKIPVTETTTTRAEKIVTIQDDLLNFTEHSPAKVEIIICMGDTLTHLNTFEEVQKLIETGYLSLEPGGLLILGFRDMTVELTGLDRFIAVRSMDSKKSGSCRRTGGAVQCVGSLRAGRQFEGRCRRQDPVA